MKTEALLEFIYSRRVTRNFEAHAVADEDLWSILEAARWAPAASNLRLHRYVCVTDPGLIERISLVSPGIVDRLVARVGYLAGQRTKRLIFVPPADLLDFLQQLVAPAL